MFKRFFSALANLTANVEALAQSFALANERFRCNILGDGDGELPALSYAQSEEPPVNGKAKKRVAAK